MTARFREEPFLQASAIPPTSSSVIAASVDYLSNPLEDPQGHWNIRMQNLQDCVCELLIKNQQLRMALMEMKAKEQRKSGVPNA